MLSQGTIAVEATAWAAMIGPGSAGADEAAPPGQIEELGAVADAALIPLAQRRRMPRFSLNAVRCGLIVLRDAPESELVLSSRWGDLDATVKLLTDLAESVLLSPATFSHSVHNAPAGLLGLTLGAAGSHTAVAGEADSLAAGLTETYARLAGRREAASVVLLHADVALPNIYREFDESGPDVHLGLRLTLPAPDAGSPAVDVTPGRQGAADVARALAGGARLLRFRPPSFRAPRFRALAS